MPRVALADRQANLVAAARRIMAQEGFEAATTRAIAREAAVPLGIVHYCFHSKDELLEAVARSVLQDQLDAALRALQPGPDLRSAAAATLAALFDDTRRNRERHLVLAQLLGSAPARPSLKTLNEVRYRRYHETAHDALVSLAEAAHARWRSPIETLSRLVVATLDGTILAWLADGDEAAAHSVLRLLVELLAHDAEANDDVRVEGP